MSMKEEYKAEKSSRSRSVASGTRKAILTELWRVTKER